MKLRASRPNWTLAPPEANSRALLLRTFSCTAPKGKCTVQTKERQYNREATDNKSRSLRRKPQLQSHKLIPQNIKTGESLQACLMQECPR